MSLLRRRKQNIDLREVVPEEIPVDCGKEEFRETVGVAELFVDEKTLPVFDLVLDMKHEVGKGGVLGWPDSLTDAYRVFDLFTFLGAVAVFEGRSVTRRAR